MRRRAFLKDTALAMFGVGTAPAWLARTAFASGTGRRKVLVAIFQRGAVDGLNMVVPHGDSSYYALRPSIAIPKDRLLDLDGFFGFHPSLQPLQAAYEAKELAIVQATGSPDPTRSHFDAQDYMESGTPGRKSTEDGWMNRVLDKKAEASPARAVALSPQLPRALRGSQPALALQGLQSFRVKDAASSETFEGMYDETVDAVLQGAGRDTFQAVRTLKAVQQQSYTPSGGAQYPRARLGQSLEQIARLIKADVGLEVAFADMGGWDTHVNEVGAQPATGQLANLLGVFAQSIAAFRQDLGDRMADVVVVSMSEFGRTARENGNRGTDHGHANAMLVWGGPIRGGKVYGDWPGLDPEQLYEGRDLAVTTDFRAVLGELVTGHLGQRNLASVFPGYEVKKTRGLLV